MRLSRLVCSCHWLSERTRKGGGQGSRQGGANADLRRSAQLLTAPLGAPHFPHLPSDRAFWRLPSSRTETDSGGARARLHCRSCRHADRTSLPPETEQGTAQLGQMDPTASTSSAGPHAAAPGPMPPASVPTTWPQAGPSPSKRKRAKTKEGEEPEPEPEKRLRIFKRGASARESTPPPCRR